jgi:peptide deformylase
MAVLPILTCPDPILKQKSLAVTSVDDQVRKLMDDMISTMDYQGNASGLAAPQVGALKRVLVLDAQADDETQRPKGFYPLFIANPEIIVKSEEMVVAFESCLSVPEQSIEVARHAGITVKYLDYNNNAQELRVKGWIARVFQHEIDHLDGKLTIDYLGSVKRDATLRKLKKIKRLYI